VRIKSGGISDVGRVRRTTKTVSHRPGIGIVRLLSDGDGRGCPREIASARGVDTVVNIAIEVENNPRHRHLAQRMAVGRTYDAVLSSAVNLAIKRYLIRQPMHPEQIGMGGHSNGSVLSESQLSDRACGEQPFLLAANRRVTTTYQRFIPGCAEQFAAGFYSWRKRTKANQSVLLLALGSNPEVEVYAYYPFYFPRDTCCCFSD